MLAVYYVIICFLLGKRHWPSSFCYYFSRWISSQNGQPSKVWSRKEVSERAQVVRDWDGMGWIGVPQNGWWKLWKTLFFNGWFGGKTHYFRKHPYEQSENPEVLDAFVMVQWNMECPQDAFYAENRRIFPLPWLWEEGYFLLVTCTFLWMNQTKLAALFWNELTHLETMTPNAKTQKGWRHWCCLNLVLFKPWLRFRVLGFFAPIFEKLINPTWQYVQIKRTIQPRTSEGWRIHRRSRLFFSWFG